MTSEETDYRLVCLETFKEMTSSRGFSGRGRARYPNGDCYEGEFMLGERAGRGIYKYKNGNEYSGQWKSNYKAGIGEMRYKNGNFYKGQFQNSQKHGEGKLLYKNGDYYSGQWKYGSRNGKGEYYFAKTKQVLRGDWVRGYIETGEWILPNNIKFLGEFKNNIPVGRGVWELNNGKSISGMFVDQPLKENEEEENVEDDLEKENKDRDPFDYFIKKMKLKKKENLKPEFKEKDLFKMDDEGGDDDEDNEVEQDEETTEENVVQTLTKLVWKTDSNLYNSAIQVKEINIL